MEPHSEAVNEASTVLPSSTAAPGAARQFLDHHAAHLPQQQLDDARTLVSELATNAMMHGGAVVYMHVRTHRGGVRVDIHDDGAGLPTLAATMPPARSPSGRGLFIVDALATRWGVDASEPAPGKTVWFELEAPPG